MKNLHNSIGNHLGLCVRPNLKTGGLKQKSYASIEPRTLKQQSRAQCGQPSLQRQQ